MREPKRRIYLGDDGDPQRAERDRALRAGADRARRIGEAGEEAIQRVAQRANRNAPPLAGLVGLFGKPLGPPAFPAAGTDFRTLLRRARGPRFKGAVSQAQAALLAATPPPFEAVGVREGVLLSVQAGPSNASEPRGVALLADYASWELAVFPPGGAWCRVEGYEDVWPSAIAAYVPTRVVQAVFDALAAGAKLIDIKTGEVYA